MVSAPKKDIFKSVGMVNIFYGKVVENEIMNYKPNMIVTSQLIPFTVINKVVSIVTKSFLCEPHGNYYR